MRSNFFEKHATLTLIVAVLMLLSVLYGLSSIKIFNNQHTEYENRSLKNIIKQYYFSKIIDNNVGRFIKLREHPPLQNKYERPSRNYIKNLPGQLERKYYKVSTDSFGFISPSHLYENPDLKIVFLGGSTTECLYMEEEQRFPYLVGRLLEASFKTLKVNSYNGGVSANESTHSINILLNKVLAMKPQIVVLMHNINDLVMLRLQGTYDYQHSLKSHLQTSKNVFTRFEYPPQTGEISDTQLEHAFRKNLELFISICKIHEIIPVLMTQANRVENDLMYHRFNDIIREVARTHSVLLVDLAKEIPGDLDNLYDSYHYTAKGSRLAAERIYTALKSSIAPESLLAMKNN